MTEVLNPQPKCSAVLHKLMEWIDECDLASQAGKPKPECVDKDGQPLIPTDDDNLWWLTEMSARKTDEKDEPNGVKLRKTTSLMMNPCQAVKRMSQKKKLTKAILRSRNLLCVECML